MLMKTISGPLTTLARQPHVMRTLLPQTGWTDQQGRTHRGPLARAVGGRGGCNIDVIILVWFGGVGGLLGAMMTNYEVSKGQSEGW